jgi:sodium/potassium-transporting ATPase subunit alpha
MDTTQKVNLYLGVVLYAVVIVTCTVTFLQDKATADVLASIQVRELKRAAFAARAHSLPMLYTQGMMASSSAVIRDGAEKRIDPTTLVPGDIVRLCLGDRVPADLRIIYTADLKTESSSLTGEPDAIAATVVAVHEAPIECRNVVFSSSLVMNGEGYGVVIKTGDNTMIGSIASLAAGSGTGTQETLLEKEVHRFVNFIALIAFINAFAFFGIGMGRKQPWINALVNGFIVVLVANVPGACLCTAIADAWF